MRRRKQGASLIIVIVVFMFIFTVATAMLSMAASNFKARAAESKRVENLYASDSGLDVAYNIIGKTFDAATKYGYYEVELLKSENGNSRSPNNQNYKDIETDIEDLNSDISSLKNEQPTATRSQSDINKDILKKKSLIEEDENMEQLLLNEEFKRTFKNFIAESSTSQLGTGESAPNKLIDSIFNYRYVSGVSLDNISTGDFDENNVILGIKNKSNNPPELDPEVSDPINVSEGSNKTQAIYSESDGGEHYKTVSFTVYGDQFYNIAVTSTFYTEKVNENETNKRQLQATYKMLVPNYKDIYFENSNGDLNEYLATKDRALTIYGNMNINNIDGLNVDKGDVFVKGSDDNSLNDRVYGKYSGGITVNNSTLVSFEKNVITKGTFNIQNTIATTPASVTTIGENLYAGNVNVGKTDINSESPSGSNVLNINDAILNNDLTLNANNSTITIQNLYGINDENNNAKAQSSSSIIVNGNNNSTINIKQTAYLAGTAHIPVNDKDYDYQTAESGAVKGNYIAYSVPLTEAEKSKYGISSNPLEQFEYHAPLQLLVPNPSLYPGAKTDQDAKEKHFEAYWNEDGKNPSAGGIIWPHNEDGTIDGKDIYSAGAIVYQTGENEKKCVVIPSHYNADLETSGMIYQKREEFAKYVYELGQDSDNKIRSYNNETVTDFSLIADIDNIPSEYSLGDQQDKSEYAIFNGSGSKEIIITTGSENKIDTMSNPNVIKIQVGKDKNNKNTLNAVIATAGKVSIESGVTINGCIIAKGDLDIDGNDITINYDSDVIDRIQAQNFDTFKYIFGGGIIDSTNNNSSSSDDNDNNNTQNTDNADANYNLKNFLEDRLWKILK